MDFVSVIIPVYNRFEYLAESLSSVFGQTRRVDEILIVDDCSSTSVSEYLNSQGLLNRVTVLRTDRNRRVAGARNWGWRHARGNVLAFLDSDDLWEPHKVELQLNYLASHPQAAGVYGAMTAFFPDGHEQPWAHDRPPRVTVPTALIDSNICVQALMIRRSALERVDGFDESFGILDDQDMAIRLALADLRIDFIADPAVARLRRNDENFSGHAWKYFREDLAINRRYRTLLQEVYGPGSHRVHLGRVITRYGRKIPHFGLPTRILSRLLFLSAPHSRMPQETK